MTRRLWGMSGSGTKRMKAYFLLLGLILRIGPEALHLARERAGGKKMHEREGGRKRKPLCWTARLYVR